MAKSSGAGDAVNFLEADGSLFKKSLLLDEDTLRKVGYEGPPVVAEDLDDNFDHILTPSQAQDAKQCKFIIPEPGKCFKTKDGKSQEKVFINICHSDKVPEPPIYFSEDQLRTLLKDGEDDDLDDVRIPMSIGAKRVEKDKGGQQCQAYDIIINTNFYKEKILTSNLYWTFLCVVSMEALDEKHKLDLNKNDFVVMKHKACHGKPQPQFVRDKAHIREIDTTHTKPPLIQEIDTKSQKSSSSVNPPAKILPKTIHCEPRPSATEKIKEPVVREVSTKFYKKPEPVTPSTNTISIKVYRHKDKQDTGIAIIEVPELKSEDCFDTVIKAQGNDIEVITRSGSCSIKVPLNIQAFYPEFKFEKKIIKINLKLKEMDQEMKEIWKSVGTEIPFYDPEIHAS